MQTNQLNQVSQKDGSNQFVAKDGTQLDPTAVTLARSIRKTESEHNFNAVGDSGTSRGAYQFNGDNFKNWASEQGLDPNDFSPENQDKVAYGRIKKLLDQGYSQSQVASIWNSGSPDYQGKVGYNAKLGVKYDVPAYVKKVEEAYKQEMANYPSSGGTHIAQAATGTEEQPGEQKSFLRKAADFAFPIAGDIYDIAKGKNEKTAGQLAGDALLSGLWFTPMGAGANVASKVAGGIVPKIIGQTGAKVLGRAVEGAATGYGAEVATGLSEGKSLKESATPGLGTAVGAATGGVLGKLSRNQEPGKIISKVAAANNEALSATKRGAGLLERSAEQGKQTGDFLAQKGIILRRLEDTATKKYDTIATRKKLSQEANALDDVLESALTQTRVGVPIKELEKASLAAVDNAQNRAQGIVPDMQREIKNIFSNYENTYGSLVDLKTVNQIKRGQRNLTNVFDATKPKFQSDVHYQISKAAQKMVEDGAEHGGLSGIKEFNSYIGNHMDAIKSLRGLHGNAVKGGRLGDLLQQQAFSTAGGVSGFFGGGPIGSLIGAIVGHYAGGISASTMRKIMSGPLKQAILDNAQREDPQIVQELLKYIGKEGSKNVAPLVTGASTDRPGLASRLITQVSTRQAAENN